MTTEASTTSKSLGKTLLKVVLPMVAILAVVIAGLLMVKSQVTPSTHEGRPVEGAVIADFTLEKYPEGKVLASSLGKKILVINFWATWCEACIVEMPSLTKLRETYKDRGLELIAVNVDEEPATVLPKALPELGISFPVYLDPEAKLADIFDVHAIPLTAVLDGNRKVLHITSGELDWMSKEIRSKIEAWLAS